MKNYIVTKIEKAEPMGEYEAHEKGLVRGTAVRGPDREGYRVVYEDGYESWSPKDTFEACSREISDGEMRLIWPVVEAESA